MKLDIIYNEDCLVGKKKGMDKISHTRTSESPPEEQFDDEKLEEKRTRAYSRVVGYIKRKEI